MVFFFFLLRKLQFQTVGKEGFCPHFSDTPYDINDIYIYHYISIRKVDASVAYPFIPMNFEPFRQEPRAISLRAQAVAESPRILLDRWETLTVLICIDILHIIYDYTIHIESMRGTSI